MGWPEAQAAVTAAIPVAVGAKIIGGVMGAGKRRKATVSRKPKKAKKKESKVGRTTASVAREHGIPKTKTIKGREYILTATPRSKKDAETSVRLAELVFNVDAVAVHIGKGKYVVYQSKKKKTKKGKVVIRTVKDKTRSRSSSKTSKMPKLSRDRSGTIETRGGRGHIRL